ncbi:MAG: proton-conducting transporter membrane subunit [Elusimicrobia bacterium]|nr:proton-conducting transporter membrane subunit [Elusimicrobiota bacterium]
MLSLFILIPFFILILINLFFSKAVKKLTFWIAAVLFLFQALIVIFKPIEFWSGKLPSIEKLFPFSLYIDNLALVMLLSIGIIAFISLIVGQNTINDGTKRFNFINVLVLANIGMNGIVLVKDIFSLYVFLEITAVSSFILISLNRDMEALEGAFKYLILSSVATVMMLTSIALLVMYVGDTSYETIGTFFKNQQFIPFFILVAVSAFVGGLFIKGGLFPFHGWLPDAYSSAPSSVSVFLAGIVTKITGIYTLMRLIISVFGFSPTLQNLLLIVGALSILFGAFSALGQKDFKRMLAYSSISQMGYIIISLGTGTPLGIAGAVFHFFNHAIFKSQLFINSAALEEQTGTRNMDELGGLQSKMPVTSATSLIAFLSTAGIPPLAGFWSKLIIIIALWNSNHKIYALIAILAGVITLAYFLSMNHRVFFGILLEKLENIKEAKPGILFPAVLLTIITILVGLFFPFILNTFILPVQSILG